MVISIIASVSKQELLRLGFTASLTRFIPSLFLQIGQSLKNCTCSILPFKDWLQTADNKELKRISKVKCTVKDLQLEVVVSYVGMLSLLLKVGLL